MQLWLLSCHIVLPPWVWALFVRAPSCLDVFSGLAGVNVHACAHALKRALVHASAKLTMRRTFPIRPSPFLRPVVGHSRKKDGMSSVCPSFARTNHDAVQRVLDETLTPESPISAPCAHGKAVISPATSEFRLVISHPTKKIPQRLHPPSTVGARAQCVYVDLF